MVAATAAKYLIQRLECHPLSVAQAASAMRTKKLLVSDYERLLETMPGPSLFGSTVDQAPAGRLILRISALLSSSAVPASLFLGSLQNTNSTPPRFRKAVEELKSESSSNSR